MKIVVSGTFDFIHKGHEVLLNKAIELAEVYGGELIIALTTDEMALEKSHPVCSYENRLSQVSAYIHSEGYEGEYSFYPLNGKTFEVNLLHDIFDDGFTIIVVSEESYPATLEINKIFKSLQINAMTIVVVPMIMAEDGKRISSTRIRNEEITLEGNILR